MWLSCDDLELYAQVYKQTGQIIHQINTGKKSFLRGIICSIQLSIVYARYPYSYVRLCFQIKLSMVYARYHFCIL